MILLCILAATAALVVLFSRLAYLKAFYFPPRLRGRRFSLPGGDQYRAVKEQSDALMHEMEALPYEDVWITAADGTRLHGCYYHLRSGAPLQIQFHGYKGSRVRDFCGGHKLAREMGHNTLVIDQRAHGGSGGRSIAFGILERQDCLCWVEYAARRFGGETPIFLAGISMGAATVLMATALELPGNVIGIIADCPYSAPDAIIRKVCRDMRLPPALAFPFVRLGGRIFGGFDICAADALSAVSASRLPMLILHGEADLFVPCSMSRELAEANPALVRLETFPGAGHGLSCMVDMPRYHEAVRSFTSACITRRDAQA